MTEKRPGKAGRWGAGTILATGFSLTVFFAGVAYESGMFGERKTPENNYHPVPASLQDNRQTRNRNKSEKPTKEFNGSATDNNQEVTVPDMGPSSRSEGLPYAAEMKIEAVLDHNGQATGQYKCYRTTRDGVEELVTCPY